MDIKKTLEEIDDISKLFHDKKIRFDLNEEYKIKINCSEIKKEIVFTYKRKKDRKAYITIYKFHFKGKLKGKILKDKLASELLLQEFEFIEILLGNNVLLKCNILDKNSKYYKYDFLIEFQDFNKIEILNL